EIAVHWGSVSLLYCLINSLKFGHCKDGTIPFLHNSQTRSKAFNRSTYEKFYQTIKGWHAETINPFTEEDEKVHWAMSLLLLDRDAYGFRGID
ncbi:hypothetical protein, partial [Dyadobacter sp. 50-39]|uniref:hypothetical protein n=1 Tax=Dyadobacter sp. 50-39 TaxID=1895756 RepID=UPI000A426EC2